MKTFLGRLFVGIVLLLSFTRLENPAIAVVCASILTLLILWLGAENAVRSFESKKYLQSESLRVEGGAAGLYASLLVTSLVFELGVSQYWGETSVLGILFTLFTFVSLCWGFTAFVKYLAQRKCPEIEFM